MRLKHRYALLESQLELERAESARLRNEIVDIYKAQTELVHRLHEEFEEKSGNLHDTLLTMKISQATGNFNPMLRGMLRPDGDAMADLRLPDDGPPDDSTPARDPTEGFPAGGDEGFGDVFGD